MQTLIQSEDFTASNGSAWPTKSTTWTTSFRGGTGTIDVQSNRGRMLTGATGGYLDAAQVKANRYLQGPIEMTWRWVVENPVVESYPTMGLGDSFSGENQLNGVGIDADIINGGYNPFYVINGTYTGGTYVALGHTNGLDINCRMIIKAGLLRFKAWETTNEPSAWTCEWATPFEWEGGYLMSRFTNGAAGTARTIYLEDLKVRSLLPPLPAVSAYKRR